MKSLLNLSFAMMLVFLLVAGCNPTEVEATPTSTSTSPPPSTPTYTPEPQNLTLRISVDGMPLTGATVQIIGEGIDEQFITEESAEISIQDISSSEVSITVAAQGYLTFVQDVTLSPGDTIFDLELIKDPFGISVLEACDAPKVNLLIADMQNGEDSRIATTGGEEGFEEGGWMFTSENDVPENIFLNWTNTVEDRGFSPNIGFSEAIPIDSELNFRIKLSGDAQLTVHYQTTYSDVILDGETFTAVEYGFSFYDFDTGGDFIRLARKPEGRPDVQFLYNYDSPHRDGEWHLVELTNYDGVVAISIDGIDLGKWLDAKPFPPGSLFFGASGTANGDSVDIDDIVVCQ